jgi:hypothetical protein
MRAKEQGHQKFWGFSGKFLILRFLAVGALQNTPESDTLKF